MDEMTSAELNQYLENIAKLIEANVKDAKAADAFVILIQKKIRFEFLQGDQIVFKQFPAYTLRLGFPVLGLRYAPLGTWGPTDLQFHPWPPPFMSRYRAHSFLVRLHHAHSIMVPALSW